MLTTVLDIFGGRIQAFLNVILGLNLKTADDLRIFPGHPSPRSIIISA